MRRALAAAVVVLLRDAGDHSIEWNLIESAALDLEGQRGIGVDVRTADRLIAYARDPHRGGRLIPRQGLDRTGWGDTEVPSLAT